MAKRTRWVGWGGAAAVVLAWSGCVESSSDDAGQSTATASDGSITAPGFGGEVSGNFTSQTATDISSDDGGDGHSSDVTVSSSATDGTTASVTDTASATDVSVTDGADSGGEDPAGSCGVEFVPDPGAGNEFLCACDVCNVEFHDVTPESGWAAIEACSCICDAVGCGSSVSGGVTSGAGGDTGDGDTGATDPSWTTDATDTDATDTDATDTDATDTSVSTSSN
jgi:hypothetical protein